MIDVCNVTFRSLPNLVVLLDITFAFKSVAISEQEHVNGTMLTNLETAVSPTHRGFESMVAYEDITGLARTHAA